MLLGASGTGGFTSEYSREAQNVPKAMATISSTRAMIFGFIDKHYTPGAYQ